MLVNYGIDLNIIEVSISTFLNFDSISLMLNGRNYYKKMIFTVLCIKK